MKITILILSITFLISCTESTEKLPEKNNTIETISKKDTINSILEPVIEELTKEPQTVDERIADIKRWYSEIQKLQNNSSNTCEKWIEKYKVTNVTPDMAFDLENHAEACRLDNGFAYRKIELNGYEWGSKTTHYYKDNELFFVFVSGGSEGWAYDQRIYFDSDGNPIRILNDENDHDGNAPTNRTDVTGKNKGEEIMKELKTLEEKFAEIKLNSMK